MSRVYLYPMPRRIEILSALFAGGYGLFIGMRHAMDGLPPINWTGFSEAVQVGMAWALMAAAMMHAIGVRVNGRSWLSPFLRLFGMATHAAFFGMLTVLGASSSAGYTYAWVTVALALGVVNAIRDSVDAWNGEVPAWKVN